MGPHKDLGPGMSPPVPGSVPICQTDDGHFYQSLGIENYICNLVPKFAALSPKEKAIDDMFAGIKEDCMQAGAPYLFGKPNGATELVPIMEKHFGIAEGFCPESGFINGKDFPTKADLAVLNMAKGAAQPLPSPPRLSAPT